MRIFLGGYGADRGGSATGIGVLHAGSPDDASAGGELSRRGGVAALADSPSWIAWHPTLPVVYAALEERGAVQAFARTGPEAFAPLGEPVQAGAAVCHVAAAPDGRALIAACWGDGRLVRIDLDAEGALGVRTELPPASDPHAGVGMDESARTSRAHQTRFLPGGGFVTTDLGFDLVRFWRAGTGPARPDRVEGQVVLPRGSGPRHLRRHPSGYLFVVTELSDELFVLGLQPGGGWGIVGGTPLSPAVVAGVDSAAELALSRDGRFAYVGVRGSDTIAVLELRGDGAQVRPVALVESGVAWPRHHLVVRDTLLVAGQRSDEVAALTLDERTGVPGRARRRVEAPTPTCLLPDRD